jgi:transposase-like protein
MTGGRVDAAGTTGQHFLLSAAARGLSVGVVARLTEEEAFKVFCGIRWCDTEGSPVCPNCNCDAIYELKSRRLFKCKRCEKQFSVTAKTIFHGHKLALRDILTAIALFANGAKGHSALQMSRDLDVQYKTAFVLCHKLREALADTAASLELSGEVEVDGAYFGGYLKPANWRENRRDRRLAKNQNGKREVVVVARERAGRTITTVVKQEGEAVDILANRIAPGTIVHADEARSWDPFSYAGLELRRINHEDCYSDGEACTNQAESFNSRIRRAEIGIHHHIAGPYLGAYAAEMAWREDARRHSNKDQFLMIGLAAAIHPPSKRWTGYWQRRKARSIR